MVSSATTSMTTAQALLRALGARGIDYFFGNAGTDFAPLIDAFAWAMANGETVPQPLTVAHEGPAVAMAYGVYMTTGRAQAVMVHVNVGTANALSGIMNAARDNVPILFMAGRTPIMEHGALGARDLYIHWAQESFDQAAMVREYVKWDYELRRSDQLPDVIDRALEIAMSEPRGPVYLTLAREVLAAPFSGDPHTLQTPKTRAAASPQPSPEALNTAAAHLAGAKHPLIITGLSGRDTASVPLLVTVAERTGAAVVEFTRRAMNFPTDHPQHLGFDPCAYVAEADTILVLESDVPWFPHLVTPQPTCTVIQAGADPHFTRYPMRNFPCHVALTGRASNILSGLLKALDHHDIAPQVIAAKMQALRAQHVALRQQWQHALKPLRGERPIDPRWLTHCIQQIKTPNTIVVNEYDLLPAYTSFSEAGTFFGSSSASGLGWGLGAALGAKLANSSADVIATVGDGAYMFGNPTPCHLAANALSLPVLFIVFNNAVWGAVQQSNRTMYPQGWAQRVNQFPLSELTPSPQFELIAQANGGYGEYVTQPEQLLQALRRAQRIVREERRQALVNVAVAPP